ncbi:MAG: nicotinate phosphoribosyltransferase [Geobacter sp.]|nr:nicotinate phosphoribosyltransferase [Geobacter sp.]
MRFSPLLTDLYELTMLAGYFEEGMHETPAVFDLFFRHNPFKGGYAIFAGLDTALSYLENLTFNDDEIAYLQGLGIFKPGFLEFLRSFRFRGRITAMPEGSAVFGREPLVTVEGTLAEAQFVETALLNIINFQTLVATKSARICHAAGKASVIEFGLRRAHGPNGGLSVARAAYIGGARSTSNVEAGFTFGIPVKGTHAHSWIMSFPDELTAFRKYAEVFPESCLLLVDTYDTLKSGVPNAINVGKELLAKGYELLGIRIDSGDLAYLSRESRRMLDEAGFPDARIVASNEIDEYVIESILAEGGRVDIYGVGTKLATCSGTEGVCALGGVYKLVRIGDRPKLKVTSDIAKSTLPDRKRVLRVIDPDGSFHMDIIALADEEVRPGDTVYNPASPLQHTVIPDDAVIEELRLVVMENGKRTRPTPTLDALADHCTEQLQQLPQGCLRHINPHIYKVSISRRLNDLRNRLIEEVEQGYLV